MLLYLAGVNEHAVLRIVGSKRWSVAHFLRTIQYLFEYGVRFLATRCYCTSCESLRRRKERNYFLFDDHPRAVSTRSLRLSPVSHRTPIVAAATGVRGESSS